MAALTVLFGANSLQNATANGDTRTISFHHIHLKEDTTITYKVNGRYDSAALQKINHALRDWRSGQPTNMDPHLIDALWEVYRATGAQEPIHVIGGFRSPATNAMLRRRSSGVAKHSLHMQGKAIDFYIPGVELSAVREAGLRLQRGGVGFYPSSGAPFVHMDVGGVRHWPRIPEAQLARILAKGPLTQVASVKRARAVAVASRTTRDEDETPAPAVVAAAVPMPKARPATAPEPVESGFSLASASSQPVRTPSRPAPAPVPEQSGFNLASASSQPVRPTQTASHVAQPTPSANDIINERGYWQSLAEVPPRPPADIPESPEPRQESRMAAAEPPVTGSVARGDSLAMPWPMPDRRPAREAMAYAPANQPVETQAGDVSKVRYIPKAGASKTETAAIRRAKPTPKRPATQTATVKVGERFNDPWMRAMMLAPNAQNFMSTSLYGGLDVASIRDHMRKPATTVMMTFSEDPHLGMTTDHFKGNAVVFVATVTFRQRTAALQ